METKICKICGEEKTLDNYYFRKDSNKYSNKCKLCHNKICKTYRENNIEKCKELSKKYRENHRDEILLKKAEYREKNREQLKEKAKQYYKDNIDTIKIRRKQQRKKSNETTRKYVANRKKNDKVYVLKCQMRHLLISSFNRKNYVKKSHLEEIVGISINELIKHLLKTFRDNYGYEWDGIEKVHIDHEKPLKYAKTEEEVIKLCHYTNLQLLKAEDNLKKGAKLDWKIGINE